MKTQLILIVVVGFAIFSCSKGRDSVSKDEISGAYTREYSFKVINSETGIKIGMRTIRDTIFIRSKGNGYEVSNNKWSLNDYDGMIWRNMEHSDDRSMPTYQANFDMSNSSLSDKDSMPSLYLSPKTEQLFKTKSRQNPYGKIK